MTAAGSLTLQDIEDALLFLSAAAQQRKIIDLRNDDSIKRRACVVLILRECDIDINGNKKVELLFIRRALHPLDKWSGHIAFPGGRQDLGETDTETCRRETFEEIGLELNKFGTCIGRLNDTKASKSMGIGVYVYKLNHQSTNKLKMKLDSKEVADVLWVPLPYFIGDNHLMVKKDRRKHPIQTTLGYNHEIFNLKKSLSKWNSKLPSFVAWLAKPIASYISFSMTIQFPCIYLPRKDETTSTIKALPKRTDPHDFVLWGITLGIVTDFFQQIHNYHSSSSSPSSVSSAPSYQLQLNPTPMKTKILHSLRRPYFQKMILLFGVGGIGATVMTTMRICRHR